jgi:hypothetical protein
MPVMRGVGIDDLLGTAVSEQRQMGRDGDEFRPDILFENDYDVA